MKTLRIGIMLAFAASLASCSTKNTEMKTVVESDGSCYREFQALVDSAFMVQSTSQTTEFFPVELDSTWEISWKVDHGEPSTTYPLTPSQFQKLIGSNRKIEATVRKHFNHVSDMTTHFKWKDSNAWSELNVTYSLEKKFRWFYTYYTFCEMYPRIETNFDVELDSFMTKDESNFWLKGSPNLVAGMNGVEIREFTGQLEDKFTQWYFLNSWHIVYQHILSNYDSIESPPVDKAAFASFQDSIYNTLVKGNEQIKMQDALNKFYRTTAFSDLWKNKNSLMTRFENQLENTSFERFMFHSVTYNLVMPGKVIRAENGQLSDNIITWNVTAYRMLNTPYTLKAESRKANIWAFILSGLVVALAIGSLWYNPKKKSTTPN